MTAATAMDSIDWPTFIAQQDMHFTPLPQRWEEAPHFGNAMVGSMLYQQDDVLRLQLFRQDVQDHREDDYGWTAYSRPRLMIGHFELHTTGQLTGCNWRKHLWNAELTGTITTDRGEIGIRHLVHAQDMAIMTELSPSDGEHDCSWTWHPHPAETTRPGYPRTDDQRSAYAESYGRQHHDRIKLHSPNPDGQLEERGDVHVWIQNLLAGGQYATVWTQAESDATRTHMVCIAKSYPQATAADTAVDEVKRCITSNRQDWIQAHRDWWHDYYRQSYVTLPDKQVEALYWQTVYRLGCTSRAGRFYIDTSGLWFQGGPWAYTTHDWNTQSAHWGVYAANRLEQGRDIVDRLHRYRDNLIEAVRPSDWQDDCAYLPLSTVGDMRGNREGDMRYYNLVGNLPWVLHNAWWQYRFSMDEAMLRDQIVPLLRRATNLYLRMLEEGDDGRLHLPATYSPETGSYPDANFDLALFKWSCYTLLHACEVLNIDDPLIPRWQDVVERLIDFPVDDESFMLAADVPAPRYHRHLSHLLMVYPLHLVNIDQAGTESVLQHAHRRVQIAVQGEGDENQPNQAMIQTHAVPIACALGIGDAALEGLQRQIAELHPNGLWSCAGNPCFESSVSLMSLVQDMLIQSWSDPAKLLDGESGVIRVFPALPEAWAGGDLEFQNLRTEGAFLVSAKRESGRTRWIRVESLAGQRCRIMLDESVDVERQIEIVGEREHGHVQHSRNVFELDIKQGEAVTLVWRD